jgi:hypothetical protein
MLVNIPFFEFMFTMDFSQGCAIVSSGAEEPLSLPKGS